MFMPVSTAEHSTVIKAVTLDAFLSLVTKVAPLAALHPD